jgi:hypothetical protein
MDKNKEAVVDSILSQLKENKDGTASAKLINGDKTYTIEVKPFNDNLMFKGISQIIVMNLKDNKVGDYRISESAFENELRRVVEEL